MTDNDPHIVLAERHEISAHAADKMTAAWRALKANPLDPEQRNSFFARQNILVLACEEISVHGREADM